LDIITVGNLLLVFFSIGYVVLRIVLLLMDRKRTEKR
jgi:hypothetical protein